MKRLLCLAAAAALCASARAADDAALVKEALATINAQDVMECVEYLTADACAGRDTGQPGLTLACEYVAGRFQECGLEPLGSAGTFLAEYALTVMDAAEETSLIVAGARDGDMDCVLREQFIPAARSAAGVAEGEVVFAGYGIKERKFRWDSYKKIDARGKVVLVLTREPRADRDNPRFFEGLEMSAVSSLREKARVASEQGAVGLLISAATDEESAVWLKSQFPRHAGGGRRRGGQELALPAALVTPDVGERIAGRPLLELRDEIDEKQSPQSFAVPQVRVRLEVSLAEKGLSAANVVARYRGSDADLVGAAVVVGAHLDHIGVDDRGRIYRGADDNAAGVAALLEVAEAYATSKPPTRRSVIFVAFTGEEKGLLGAYAYVHEPPVPITQTYAMINMDIISRGRKNAIEATPPPKASFLDQLLKKAVALSDCELKVGDGGKEFFQQSDHYAFHEAGVPTLFLNEGDDPEDLHTWRDTADKVLDEKVARVARLAFALSYMAANSDLKGGLR